MKVWVLFVWLTAGNLPTASLSTFKTQAECREDGRVYANYVCVEVFVPMGRR